jgi:hypothetical protein
VCSRFEVEEGSPPPDGSAPREYFERLCREEQYDLAIEFLAHALPARAAAWWGCLCLWNVARPAPPPPVDAALAAALGWVLDPTEEQRRAAESAAADADDLPAGHLAQAVFFSGGSLIAPNLPVVEPPPFHAQRAVAGAILLAAGQTALARDEQLRMFCNWGADVADGKIHWSRT